MIRGGTVLIPLAFRFCLNQVLPPELPRLQEAPEFLGEQPDDPRAVAGLRRRHVSTTGSLSLSVKYTISPCSHKFGEVVGVKRRSVFRL